MKVCFFTLGCKVNLQESAAMEDKFRKAGYTVVGEDDVADVYVVNSCTVTQSGDRKSAAWIRRAKRKNPNAVVLLRGCMPQAFPEKAEGIKEADIIIGTRGKGDAVELVEKFMSDKKRYVNIIPHSQDDEFEELDAGNNPGHTRSFLKIEDGCNRRCAYCIIPIARGRVRSLPVERVVRQAKTLAQAGHREIVLTGVNISCYGQDIGRDVRDVIEAVSQVNGVERVRLGSLELDLFTDEMLVRMSMVKKFCPHFHLSLQSGCDKTLKNMNRLYDRKLYTDMMNRLKELFYRPTFTTDIIVGFPGESEEDFLDSVSFVTGRGFLRVHSFPYSQRPGTAGARMHGQLSEAEKKRRNRIMIYKASQSAARVMESFVGFEDTVVLEKKNDRGFFTGYTSRYIPVLAEDKGYSTGDEVKVRLTGVKDGKMTCRILP